MALKLHFDDPVASWVEVAIMLTGTGEPQMKVGHQYTHPNGEGKHDMFPTRTLPSAGRLRLVRIGGTAYGLYAPHGTDDFQFVGSVGVGTMPIKRAEVTANSADEHATIDVILQSLTIKTKPASQQLSQQNE